jgi:hypothetical protein
MVGISPSGAQSYFEPVLGEKVESSNVAQYERQRMQYHVENLKTDPKLLSCHCCGHQRRDRTEVLISKVIRHLDH